MKQKFLKISDEIWLGVAGCLLALPYLFDLWADPDLWWHLKSGLSILETGQIPALDPYSYTYPSAFWTNHEWLAEVLFALAYRGAGSGGLLVLRIILFFLFLFSFMRLCRTRSRSHFLTILVTLLAIPYLNIFLNVRPHSFMLVFLLFCLLILDAYRQGKVLPLCAVPLLMLLWVNIHGSFFLGLMILTAALIFERLPQSVIERPHGRRYRYLIGAVVLLTWGITLANPYGARLYFYLGRELMSAHQEITEWQKLQGVQLVHFMIFAILPLSGILLALKRCPASWRKIETLFYLFFLFGALFRGRLFVLLVLFGSLVLAQTLGILVSKQSATKMAVVWERLNTPQSLAFFCLILLIPAGVALEQRGRPFFWGVRVDPIAYPVDAVTFLKKNFVGPRLLQTFQWGGYAIWHLWPDYRVAVDGRNVTVYPDGYVEKYIALYQAGDKDWLDLAPADAILIESQGTMAMTLRQEKNWKEVYRDPAASVFLPKERVRRGAGTILRFSNTLSWQRDFVPFP